MRISHETIYRSLYVQSRGEQRRQLTANLRTGRSTRRSRDRIDARGGIREMVPIAECPAEVDERRVPGHWEGDLLIGAENKSAIATLVERQTRNVLLARLGLALLTATVGGAGFAAEEGISFGNGLYWAIATMTTVGDNLTPKTTEGKIISVVVMLVGIGTATLLIGAVAQRFLAPDVEHVEATEDDLLAQVREISTQLGKLEHALRERTYVVGEGQPQRALTDAP